MANNRLGRINEEILRETAALIRTLKDPRVANSMVSITRVEATPDMRYAKIYVSVLGDESALRDCVRGLRKAAALAHVLRQNVRDAVKAGVQPLAHGLQHGALIEPIAHTVDWDDAPGDGAAAGGFFVHGVHHGAAHTGGFYFPEEHIALAADEIVLRVGLIEERYVNRTALVDGAKLHELESAAPAGQARSVGDQRLDADALTAACQRDRHNGAAILIFPRKIRNKVIERNDAELCKRLRLFLPYALDVSDVGIQVGHYSVYLRV